MDDQPTCLRLLEEKILFFFICTGNEYSFEIVIAVFVIYMCLRLGDSLGAFFSFLLVQILNSSKYYTDGLTKKF